MVRDDDLRAALAEEAREARVPSDEILHRIRRSKVRLGRPGLWRRLGDLGVFEAGAACLVLVLFVLAAQHMPKLRGGGDPTAARGIVMSLTTRVAVTAIKPGETAKLPSGPIYVTMDFPERIDPASLQIDVGPATWHLQGSSPGSSAGSYAFVVRPDEGVAGLVTITLDQVKTPDGKDLLDKPAIFQIETVPAQVEMATLPEPLGTLIQAADQVTVETLGVPGSRTEFLGGERDWLVQAAQSAVPSSTTDLGHGSGPIANYRLEIQAHGRTYVVMWQSSQWFTVAWLDAASQKSAGFAQADERLANAISEVLAARQRGDSLR